MHENDIVTGAVFQHFKGFIATVITVATHTETGEKLVVYTCKDPTKSTQHTDGVFARPLEMFMSEVDHTKYPQVMQKYRFEYKGTPKWYVYPKTDQMNSMHWTVHATCPICGRMHKDVWSANIPNASRQVAAHIVCNNAVRVNLPQYCDACGTKMDGVMIAPDWNA